MNRNGPNRFIVDGRGRFVRNGFRGKGSNFNQGLAFGCCGWGGWAGSVAAPAASNAPIVVGGGPSLVINLPLSAYAGDGGAGGDGGNRGGCVVHRLQFDSAGKYTGDQQSSEC